MIILLVEDDNRIADPLMRHRFQKLSRLSSSAIYLQMRSILACDKIHCRELNLG